MPDVLGRNAPASRRRWRKGPGCGTLKIQPCFKRRVVTNPGASRRGGQADETMGSAEARSRGSPEHLFPTGKGQGQGPPRRAVWQTEGRVAAPHQGGREALLSGA